MATLPPNKSANVRSVLEYVPYFRDKIFAVHVERPLVDSGELVDALLDLDVLQEIGVRPVLIVEGADAPRCTNTRASVKCAPPWWKRR